MDGRTQSENYCKETNIDKHNKGEVVEGHVHPHLEPSRHIEEDPMYRWIFVNVQFHVFAQHWKGVRTKSLMKIPRIFFLAC